MSENNENTNENAGAAETRAPLEIAVACLSKEAKMFAKVADPETRKAFEALAEALKDPERVRAFLGSAAQDFRASARAAPGERHCTPPGAGVLREG